MNRLLITLLAAALTATLVACNVPGEPPTHPSKAAYGDVIRRETDKTTSTLATIQLVVADLRHQRITKNYSTVMSRQSIADLTAVLTDLRQITAPTPHLRQLQTHYQHTLVAAIQTIGSIPPNWNYQPSLAHIAQHLTRLTARTQHLGDQLD